MAGRYLPKCTFLVDDWRSGKEARSCASVNGRSALTIDNMAGRCVRMSSFLVDN
jgi:hypothetical protein